MALRPTPISAAGQERAGEGEGELLNDHQGWGEEDGPQGEGGGGRGEAGRGRRARLCGARKLRAPATVKHL